MKERELPVRAVQSKSNHTFPKEAPKDLEKEVTISGRKLRTEAPEAGCYSILPDPVLRAGVSLFQNVCNRKKEVLVLC